MLRHGCLWRPVWNFRLAGNSSCHWEGVVNAVSFCS